MSTRAATSLRIGTCMCGCVLWMLSLLILLIHTVIPVQQVSMWNTAAVIQTTLLSFKQRCCHLYTTAVIQTLLLSFKHCCCHLYTTAVIQTLLLSFKHYCCHSNTTAVIQTLLLSFIHYCCHSKTTAVIYTLLLSFKHCCCHLNTTAVIQTLLLSFKHYCCHSNTAAPTTHQSEHEEWSSHTEWYDDTGRQEVDKCTGVLGAFLGGGFWESYTGRQGEKWRAGRQH